MQRLNRETDAFTRQPEHTCLAARCYLPMELPEPMLVPGRSGAWRTTDRFTARLRPARYIEELGEKGAYQVHAGSAGDQILTADDSGTWNESFSRLEAPWGALNGR